MYDRATLLAAAHTKGDRTPAAVARRLSVPRNTAWRLWSGHGAPSAALAARVEDHYGVSARQLVKVAKTTGRAA